MHTFTKLFEKNYIGTMELKNRICFGRAGSSGRAIGGALDPGERGLLCR